MSVFSDAELAYLAQAKLGRLATIDATGMPHVVPLGWRIHCGYGRLTRRPGRCPSYEPTCMNLSCVSLVHPNKISQRMSKMSNARIKRPFALQGTQFLVYKISKFVDSVRHSDYVA